MIATGITGLCWGRLKSDWFTSQIRAIDILPTIQNMRICARTILTQAYSLSNTCMFHVSDLTADYSVTSSGAHLW